MTGHWATDAARSGYRSEADIGELNFRSRAFYVWLPLQSGRYVPVLPRSAHDPKSTLSRSIQTLCMAFTIALVSVRKRQQTSGALVA